VLFEFSTPVVVNRVYLGYLGDDSDASIWIGTKNNPFQNHLALSDALLNDLADESNSYSGSSSSRWADINAGGLTGNVLVVAANVGSSNDSFKIGKVELSCGEPSEPSEPANAAPVAENDAFTTDRNTPVTFNVSQVLGNDSDPDGDEFYPVLVAYPDHGTLSVNAYGGITYTPDTGFVGTDTASYKLFDGELYSEVATVTFTVEGTPAPVATDDSYSVKRRKTLTVNAPGVTGNDSTTGSIMVVKVSGPATGDLDLNSNGSFTYKAGSSAGIVTFTYKVKDASGEWSNTATVTINVTK
jgi:hypothetical protein